MFKAYSNYYELFNQDKNYKKEIQFIYKWADKPKFILDIGCGTANYWKYYPEDVFLHGIERSRDMILQSKYQNKITCSDVTENIICPMHEVNTVTALFEVINYIPKHHWWKKLPLMKGGYFVIEVWDKERVDKDGFEKRTKTIGTLSRIVTPNNYDGKSVDLEIVLSDGILKISETHRMYVWSHEDIEGFCGEEFVIEDTKETRTWQKFYKLRRI